VVRMGSDHRTKAYLATATTALFLAFLAPREAIFSP
jgi:hypothetical protein